MARDGAVGEATFEQVEALTKQGMSKTEAFAQIAGDTGRNRGTVAANYYRVARASGAVKPRKRRGKATKTASSSRARTSRGAAARNGSDITSLSDELVRSVTALADVVKQQQAEVTALHNRLEGLREAMG